MFHFNNVYYFIDKFDRDEILNLNSKIVIIYRNYKSSNQETDIIKLKNLSKIKKRKIFIANNIKLAIKHNLDGVYIPAFNNNLNLKNICLRKNFCFIGSAHNLKELRVKIKQNCESIFVSPLFFNIKNKSFLELIKFNLLSLNTKKKIVALGGINQKNFKRLYSTKVDGFASISWIKKNRPTFK